MNQFGEICIKPGVAEHVNTPGTIDMTERHPVVMLLSKNRIPKMRKEPSSQWKRITDRIK